MSRVEPENIKFPYPSNFIEVLGSNMHYIDEGQGDPILFLHGMPSSSYLWRNVIPYLSQTARCIAVDLIGMGRSEKPEIEYTFHDHLLYVEAFIERLGLKNVTLVMHGWGSLFGFHYFSKHSENIKGLAFLEAYIRPVENWNELALPVQELAAILSNKPRAKILLLKENYLVEKWMQKGVARRLSEHEMNYYRFPFEVPSSRQVLWQYTQELPFADKDNETLKFIAAYSKVLEQSALPKLMFYAVPGFNTSMASVSWAKRHLKHLTLVPIENSLHYGPETHPKLFGERLLSWYKGLE